MRRSMGIIMAFILWATGCSPLMMNENKNANHSSNIANGSVVFQYQGEIYYNSFGEGIFKFRKNPNDRKRIIEGNFSGFIIEEGWIYTRTASSTSEDAGIYRLKIDGSNLEKLADQPGLYMNKWGDWLYYSRRVPNGKEVAPVSSEGVREGGIFKLNINTKEEIKLTSENATYISVFDDWIYYINEVDNSKLYKISIYGTEKEKIAEESAVLMVIEEDLIYYYANGKIYRMKCDGTNKEIIKETSGIIRTMNVSKGWLYIAERLIPPEGPKIYKFNRETGKEVDLYEGSAQLLHVIDEYLYFFGEGNLYRMKLDGSSREGILKM